jgi:FixJ family two-component response regulator
VSYWFIDLHHRKPTRSRLIPLVHVVDDDEEVRGTIADLLRTTGLEVRAHDSAQAFLASYLSDRPGCLVLDIRMPGIDGIELQRRLRGRGDDLPVVALTGHADVTSAVRVMKDGGWDFIEKSQPPRLVVDAVGRAVTAHVTRWQAAQEARIAAERLATLSAREREVLNLVMEGNLSKVIALDLGISINTVEVHRSRIMKKMRAQSVADLVRMVLGTRAAS